MSTNALDLLREWQIRGFKLLETRAKNRFTQEVYCTHHKLHGNEAEDDRQKTP